MEDANKELVRAYTRAVFDRGDVSAVDRYLATDFYNHVTGRSGTEDFKQLAADTRPVERHIAWRRYFGASTVVSPR